jgi:uncharacterized membrane protein (UPF0136 family)
MGWLNVVLGIYALITAGLGIQAYVAPAPGKEASLVSVIAGVGMAALLVVGILIAERVNRAGGYVMCGVVSLLLLGRFAPTFFKEGTIYPAGVMVILSVVSLIALAAGHFLGQKSA